MNEKIKKVSPFPISDEVDRFVGNSSVVDNFKSLVRDENFLLIGAT
jgi:hypothetical protein